MAGVGERLFPDCLAVAFLQARKPSCETLASALPVPRNRLIPVAVLPACLARRQLSFPARSPTMHGQIVSVLIPRQAVAPLGPLRLISFLSLGYVAFTALFLAATDQDPTLVSRGFVKAIPLFGGLMAPLTANWWGLSALELLLLCPATQRAIRTRGIEATFACCYALAITNCFSFVKNSMPLILPFWADPLLARIDATLHFGQSPRDFLTWLDAFSLHGLLEVYFSFWLPAALLLARHLGAGRHRQRASPCLYLVVVRHLGAAGQCLGPGTSLGRTHLL